MSCVEFVNEGSSLPQALDELVHTIEAKAILSGVAHIHRHVL